MYGKILAEAGSVRVPGPGLQRQADNEMWKSSWQEVVVRARFSAGPGRGLWAFFFFFYLGDAFSLRAF